MKRLVANESMTGEGVCVIKGILTMRVAVEKYIKQGFYPERERHRLVQDRESKEYEIVGLPDWPAYKEAIESGEYRLVMALTGAELNNTYHAFVGLQKGLFDESNNKTGLETGK